MGPLLKMDQTWETKRSKGRLWASEIPNHPPPTKPNSVAWIGWKPPGSKPAGSKQTNSREAEAVAKPSETEAEPKKKQPEVASALAEFFEAHVSECREFRVGREIHSGHGLPTCETCRGTCSYLKEQQRIVSHSRVEYAACPQVDLLHWLRSKEKNICPAMIDSLENQKGKVNKLLFSTWKSQT